MFEYWGLSKSYQNQFETFILGNVNKGKYVSLNTKLEKKDDFDHDTAKLAIRVRNGSAVVDEEICIACGSCVRNCPVESLSIVEIPTA